MPRPWLCLPRISQPERSFTKRIVLLATQPTEVERSRVPLISPMRPLWPPNHRRPFLMLSARARARCQPSPINFRKRNAGRWWIICVPSAMSLSLRREPSPGRYRTPLPAKRWVIWRLDCGAGRHNPSCRPSWHKPTRAAISASRDSTRETMPSIEPKSLTTTCAFPRISSVLSRASPNCQCLSPSLKRPLATRTSALDASISSL